MLVVPPTAPDTILRLWDVDFLLEWTEAASNCIERLKTRQEVSHRNGKEHPVEINHTVQTWDLQHHKVWNINNKHNWNVLKRKAIYYEAFSPMTEAQKLRKDYKINTNLSETTISGRHDLVGCEAVWTTEQNCEVVEMLKVSQHGENHCCYQTVSVDQWSWLSGAL